MKAGPEPMAVSGAKSESPPHPVLTAPILPTLLRLAGPTMLVMVIQSAVNVAETMFVGRLGTATLAGYALVFPLMMLMQMMSAGGMGGGVASAIARALGRGGREEAGALALHALAIALGLALFFTAMVLAFGRPLYELLGGEGQALREALAYSNLLFAGAIAPWLLNTAGAILRGAGNMVLPAKVMACAALGQVPLSFLLVLGLGDWSGLGIAGAAIAMVAAQLSGAAFLLAALARGGGGFRPALRGGRFEGRLFRDILKVGLIGAVMTIVANLTTILVTGLVGRFGTAAIAAYGIGARLEFLQVPLIFGIGAALTTMVGINVGAGNVARAERIAWTGALLASLLTGAVGALSALFPDLWIGLFSEDPAVFEVGRLYLRIVGPAYLFLGLAMSLYFASQGAGRMTWPFVAGLGRIGAAAGGGSILVVLFDGGLAPLFAMAAAGLVLFGSVLALSVKFGAWRRP